MHTFTVKVFPNISQDALQFFTPLQEDSTRSVCWYSSVFTRWHQSTLQWWATRFLPPLAEVISVPWHAVIGGTSFSNDDLWTKKFFRLWSVTVDLAAAVCS